MIRGSLPIWAFLSLAIAFVALGCGGGGGTSLTGSTGTTGTTGSTGTTATGGTSGTTGTTGSSGIPITTPQIIFSRPGAGNKEQLYRMAIDGTGATVLTDTTANRSNGSVNEGLTILVYQTDEEGDNEIYRTSLSGGTPVNLTNHIANDYSPVISRSGNKIAFMSNRSGIAALWVMNADGSSPIMISDMDGIDGCALNADGSKVVFSAAPGGIPQIYIANSNGTGIANLSNDLGFFDTHPSFSPNGALIVFLRDDAIYTMTATGSGKTHVYTHADFTGFPAFTSDGSQIVFLGQIGFAWDILRVNANGTGFVNLTQTPGDEFRNSGYIGL